MTNFNKVRFQRLNYVYCQETYLVRWYFLKYVNVLAKNAVYRLQTTFIEHRSTLTYYNV